MVNHHGEEPSSPPLSPDAKSGFASQTAGPQCFPPSADETEVDLAVEPGVHKYSVPHSSQGIEGKHFALPAVLGERWRSGLTRPVVAAPASMWFPLPLESESASSEERMI